MDSDGDTLHGVGCPKSSQVQQLGGSVTAWCWILVDSGKFLAKTKGVLGLIEGLYNRDQWLYSL